MKKSLFHYELPSSLIARFPLEERSSSRLLVLNQTGDISHKAFSDCLGLFELGDLLVFNNTKVIPARLYARKETGGAAEILVERFRPDNTVVAQIRASKSPKAGSKLLLEDGSELEVLGREDAFFVLASQRSWSDLLEDVGHMPLPPYIDRADSAADKQRYQTVYAKTPGAVAAPTAGLHFDQHILDAIREKGVEAAEVTLHVGAGTYQPVRAENIEDHVMHSEWVEMTQEACDAVEATKARGGRVIAIGTTAMRTLESVASRSNDRSLNAYSGDTDIFIYPGYEFKCVDAMVTNFHLPESSLLMLVSAFSGYSRIRAAYQAAIDEEYRFFSYGDAMFLEKNEMAKEDLPK